jgi:hypothetical protein
MKQSNKKPKCKEKINAIIRFSKGIGLSLNMDSLKTLFTYTLAVGNYLNG